MLVRSLYTVFMAALMATFIGVGISAFYPAPDQPEYPHYTEKQVPGETQTPADLEREREFQKAEENYQKASQTYNRNVAAIAVGLSVILVLLGLFVLAGVALIGDGVLLGGIFTLTYGILRSFGAEDQRVIFGVVAAGLAVAMSVAYVKFIRPADDKRSPRH